MPSLAPFVKSLYLPPSALTHLTTTGASSLRPSYNPLTKRWSKALVSPRIAARFRKELHINGGNSTALADLLAIPIKQSDSTLPIVSPLDHWTMQLARGSRATAGVNTTTHYGTYGSLKQPRMQKKDRNREMRAVKIEDKMKTMDKKIEDYKELVNSRKPVKGIETLFKKLNFRKN